MIGKIPFETEFFLFIAAIVWLIVVDSALFLRMLWRLVRGRKQKQQPEVEVKSAVPAHMDVRTFTQQVTEKATFASFEPQKIVVKRPLKARLKDKFKQFKLVRAIARVIRTFKKIIKTIYRPFHPIVRLINKLKWIIFNVVLLAFLPYAFNDMFIKPLNVDYFKPKMNSTWMDQEKVFEVQFDRPINTKKMGHEIYPDIKGKWVYEDKGIPFFKRKLKFVPEESILPDNHIQIYISNITNYAQRKPTWDKVMDFESAKLPKIVTSYPGDGSKDFGVDEEVIFLLDQPDGKFVNWEVKIEPEVEFDLGRNTNPDSDTEDRKQLKIRFRKILPQNQKYKITIKNAPQAYDVKTTETLITGESTEPKTLIFTTVKAPDVSKIEPTGEGALVNKDIIINFDYDMVQQEVENGFKISPEFAYKSSWKDGKTFVINPNEDLKKETTYTITLPKGLHNTKGGVGEKAISHKFTTVGAVKVSSTSPGNSSTSRSISSSIQVSFNQEVDHASAQGKFSISPKVSGSFSWNGNTMTFKPSGKLAYLTTYNITVAKGVKTVHGLDGKEDYKFRFTTESQIFSLNIPYTRQPYRFACNLTAAKMAMDFKGVHRSVEQIHAGIGTDSTPWNSSTNTWGNPHSRFVGNLTGSGSGPFGTGGYGVYWGPIRNYIASQGRPAEVKTGWNTSALANEVHNGHPVIIWAHNGYSGSGAGKTWNSPSGNVYAVKGMHSYVVRGFIGSADNPASIILADPGRGSNYTVSRGYFDSLWGTFGRMAVVVR